MIMLVRIMILIEKYKNFLVQPLMTTIMKYITLLYQILYKLLTIYKLILSKLEDIVIHLYLNKPLFSIIILIMKVLVLEVKLLWNLYNLYIENLILQKNQVRTMSYLIQKIQKQKIFKKDQKVLKNFIRNYLQVLVILKKNQKSIEKKVYKKLMKVKKMMRHKMRVIKILMLIKKKKKLILVKAFKDLVDLIIQCLNMYKVQYNILIEDIYIECLKRSLLIKLLNIFQIEIFYQMQFLINIKDKKKKLVYHGMLMKKL